MSNFLNNNKMQFNKMSNSNFQRINQEDEYIWCDFIIEFRKEFDTFDELCDQFVKQYPKVLAYIRQGNGYMLKKDTQIDLHSRITHPTMLFKFTIQNIVKGKMKTDTQDIKFNDLVEHLADRLPLYSKETFRPCDYKLQRYEYNTWTGFKADITGFDKKMDMGIVNPILDYIKEIISNNNQEVFKYLLSWLRHIIVKPYLKTMVAVFLHSDEKGTGKGTLGYWLKNYVFGSHLSSVVCGLSKITQKHNACIQKKIFTMVDEIPASQGEFHSQFDTMKHLITDPETTIEPKGVDPYEIPNMVNFLMMSNNVMALKIEKGDRRYACIEVSASKKGDEEYWDHIQNDVLTEESAKHFFQYLKHLPSSECVSLRKIPKTELRDRMINNSIPAYERFFLDIKDLTYEIPSGAFMNEFTTKGENITNGLRAETLYRIYEGYCITRKETCLRFRLFFTAVKKYIDKRIVCVDGKTVQFYTIR